MHETAVTQRFGCIRGQINEGSVARGSITRLFSYSVTYKKSCVQIIVFINTKKPRGRPKNRYQVDGLLSFLQMNKRKILHNRI